MNLAELRAELERAVSECPANDLPELTGLLEVAKVRAMARALCPAPPMVTDDIVGVATLSAELGLKESWLRAQARAEKLPSLRAGKYIKFRRAEVMEALADHRMRPPVRAKKRSNGAGSFPSVSTGDGSP